MQNNLLFLSNSHNILNFYLHVKPIRSNACESIFGSLSNTSDVLGMPIIKRRHQQKRGPRRRHIPPAVPALLASLRVQNQQSMVVAKKGPNAGRSTPTFSLRKRQQGRLNLPGVALARTPQGGQSQNK